MSNLKGIYQNLQLKYHNFHFGANYHCFEAEFRVRSQDNSGYLQRTYTNAVHHAERVIALATNSEDRGLVANINQHMTTLKIKYTILKQ